METIVEWAEKEEEMFHKWLSIEEKEWKLLEYKNYERIEWGFQEDQTLSIWQSQLYKKLYPRAKKYEYFFVYFFQSEINKFYFVDVGYEGFDFRVSIDLYREKGSAEMYFKHREDAEYADSGKYPSLEGERKNVLKKFATSVFDLYEEFKKTVLNEPSNRLRFLMEGFRIDECFIHKMKEEMVFKS